MTEYTEAAEAVRAARPPIRESKALEYNFCAESMRLFRRYNRPQLWRACVWITGRDYEGEESTSEVDLIPSAAVVSSRLAQLCIGHFHELRRDYAEVYDAGVTLFRLDRKNYDRLRAEHDEAEELAV